jgi:proline iminopeptidase
VAGPSGRHLPFCVKNRKSLNQKTMTQARFVIAVALLTFALPPAHAQKRSRSARKPAKSAKQTPAPARTPALTAGVHEVVLNGVRFWYRVAGSSEKSVAPVVFLHGGPGYNSHSFSVLEGPKLERSLLMVYFDQRGAGHSERPWSGHYQLDTLVQDVEALRRVLGVPRISLIGHSFGGLLALEYAARYPDNVSRLILVGAFSDGPQTCRVHRARLAGMHLVELARVLKDTAWTRAPRRSDCEFESRALTSAERERFNNSGMFPDSTLQKKQDSVDAASGLKNTGEMSRALIGAGLLAYRFTKHDQVTAPALLIAGAEDNAVGVAPQRALAAALPRARIAVYERAGHFPYLEEPVRFARDASSFLSAESLKR